MKKGLVIGLLVVVCLFTLFVIDLPVVSRIQWSPAAMLFNTSLSSETRQEGSVRITPSICNNQKMEDVSLFYRIDIKTERNQSIKGVSICTEVKN